MRTAGRDRKLLVLLGAAALISLIGLLLGSGMMGAGRIWGKSTQYTHLPVPSGRMS